MKSNSALFCRRLRLCGMALAALFLSRNTQAQNYQLLNPGFEDWETSDLQSEPLHWNSFATSDGIFAGLASTPHHSHCVGGRPGTSGSSFLKVYATSIIGIVANGNMTTGRIHAGSMTPDGEQNYNYTQRDNSDFSQPFSATPDSMYVWLSYYAASDNSRASVSAFIHGDVDFRSPNDEDNADMLFAKAEALLSRTTSSPDDYNWVCVKVPFVRTGDVAPSFVLVNITNNEQAGGGSDGDAVSVDDIEFVYSAWLTDIQFNGVSLSGFRKDVFDYTLFVPTFDDLYDAQITYSSEVPDVHVAVLSEYGDSSVVVAIDVLAEDQVTHKTYTVTLRVGNPDVAVDPCQSASRVSSFPNPVSSVVTVSAEAMRHVELSDLSGRVLLHIDFQQPVSSHQLDLSSIPAGLYILSVDGHSQQLVKM